jgi:hypothetical protein
MGLYPKHFFQKMEPAVIEFTKKISQEPAESSGTLEKVTYVEHY